MIVLYHCMSARSFRPLWMLEEIGLDYDLRMLPFPPRVLSEEFMAVNPLGTIPAFFDGAIRMTESAAICHYLAARHAPRTLNVEVDEGEFAAYLQWLHFGEATLTFPQAIALRYSRLEPEERRIPQAASDYIRWFLSRLRGVEAALADRTFMCAERFTAADISIGYALMLARHLALEYRFSPRIAAYWQRLQHRDGFVRAIAAQENAAIAQGVSLTAAPDTLPIGA